jgi:hypothetical protein
VKQVSSPTTTSSIYVITNYLCGISPFIPIYSPTTIFLFPIKWVSFHTFVVLSILVGTVSFITRRRDSHSNTFYHKMFSIILSQPAVMT